MNFDALLEPTDDSAQPETTLVDGSQDDDHEHQEQLDSMMDSYGQMTMNANGSMDRDFYGAASGLAWIQTARSYFGDSDVGGSSEGGEDEDSSSAAVQIFDAPLPPKKALRADAPVSEMLPARDTATELLHVVFTQVYPMFYFIREQDFQESTDRLYQLDPNQYQERDQNFLPLFYIVVGLGQLFSKQEHDKQGCWSSVSQG